ncbi:predicted protein, partial [Nematostella vectensis]
MAAARECLPANEKIHKLAEHASHVDVDSNIPPKRYFRSGVELERMAKIYQDERNYESAFILYTKYITLFVEKLPQHPEYASVTKQDKALTMKKLPKIFAIAEELKRILTQRYEEEYKTWQEIKQKQERKRAEQQLVRELEERENSAPVTVTPSAPPPPLDGPLSSTLIGDYPAPPTLRTINSNSTITGDNTRSHTTPNETFVVEPPSPSYASLFSVITDAPSVDRSTKPCDATSGTPTVHGLRRVSVPSSLVSRFLEIASHNTRRNMETCGILTGSLQQNQFCITHLVIPKQTSTTDSCTTLSEEDMFEYQDSHNLITLGWIHTHPTQTAFMSSVDLHTHCSYQLMMPEAIAIVCSPKYNETGVFTLTQNYGLQFVASCKKHGFHPHPKEPPLY